MRCIRPLAIGLFALVLHGQTNAGPLILEETVRIDSPEAPYDLGGPVALDGDWLIATGSYVEELGPDDYRSGHAAFLFQRNVAGTWTYVRKLMERTYSSDFAPLMTVAMRAGVAAITAVDRLYIFELTPAGWTSAQAPNLPFQVVDLEIDNGTILAVAQWCQWRAQPFRKTASGNWEYFGELVSGTSGCGLYRLGDGDISGNRAILYSLSGSNLQEAHIFEVGASLPWVHVATLTSPESSDEVIHAFGSPLALQNDTALVVGEHLNGSYVFERNSAGVWDLTSRIRMPEQHNWSWFIGLRDEFALQSYTNIDHGIGVVSVFQRQPNGSFNYVARLVPTPLGYESLTHKPDISGRTVAVGGQNSTFVFELPDNFSKPAPVQDDFQSGNASQWSPSGTPSFSVVSNGSSLVYRQSSVEGEARSILANVDWTNQAIEADITPRAFSGSNRWFGLAARYTDPANYYYVTLRSSNVVELKRMVNGVFSTLASGTLPVTLNRTYRVRLEVIGTSLKAYVDGKLALQAYDASLPNGRPGVAMYKAQADIDNVLVTSNHYARLYHTTFLGDNLYPWTRPTGVWQIQNYHFLHQTALNGGALAITGVSTEDQIVQVRARADAFNGTDRWFGVVARYQDPSNHYYVTVRNSNVISLRKLVNGAITEIASAPMAVTAGTWYDLRLAAVGSTLRVWVNGKQVLQGTDTAYPSGRFGLAMYKTAASFDEFLTYEP